MADIKPGTSVLLSGHAIDRAHKRIRFRPHSRQTGEGATVLMARAASSRHFLPVEGLSKTIAAPDHSAPGKPSKSLKIGPKSAFKPSAGTVAPGEGPQEGLQWPAFRYFSSSSQRQPVTRRYRFGSSLRGNLRAFLGRGPTKKPASRPAGRSAG